MGILTGCATRLIAGNVASVAGVSTRSGREEQLESAEDQSLAVEGRRLRVHHVDEPRVVHHFGVDAVALRARLVDNPGKNNGFPGLELHASWERSVFAYLH